MMFPDRIDARWIDALSDDELRQAESELRGIFAAEQSAEQSRRGNAYDLMRGPEELTAAWMRWSLVRNATEQRGVRLAGRRR